MWTKRMVASAASVGTIAVLAFIFQTITSAGNEKIVVRPVATLRAGGEVLKIQGSAIELSGNQRIYDDAWLDDAGPVTASSLLPTHYRGINPKNPFGGSDPSGIETGPDGWPMACYDNAGDCGARMEWACGTDGPGGYHGGVAHVEYGGGSCNGTCGDGTTVTCTQDNVD